MQNGIAIAVSVCAFSSLCQVNGNAAPPQAAPPVIILATPNPALMDDRVTIKVTGLSPNRKVTIRAAMKDQRDCWWRSSAEFVVRPDGSIDLSTMTPVAGDYEGIDAMGLFWSMQTDKSPRPTSAFFSVVDWFKPVVTEIEAVSDGRVLSSSRVTRRFAAPGVRAEMFRSNGVVGILYRPGDDHKHPGVILLGGSEGGFPEPEGPMLASRGFVVLALAYFGMNGLPATMQRIPIEYFGRAIHSMRLLPAVGGAPVSILGGSRGAEAALIVASTYPEVRRVVAVSPSNVRWEGSTRKLLPGGPAWTYDGKPLPYIPFHVGSGFAARYLWATVTRGPLSLRPMFLDSLARVDKDEVEIPVERIHGPILFGSGGDDRKWPSALMAKRAMDRLRRNQHPYADEHLTYEAAGHWLPSAYLPTSGLRGQMANEIGGTPIGTAIAQRQWWPEVLRFLAGKH